jgi:hypothetical protein
MAMAMANLVFGLFNPQEAKGQPAEGGGHPFPSSLFPLSLSSLVVPFRAVHKKKRRAESRRQRADLLKVSEAKAKGGGGGNWGRRKRSSLFPQGA